MSPALASESQVVYEGPNCVWMTPITPPSVQQFSEALRAQVETGRSTLQRPNKKDSQAQSSTFLFFWLAGWPIDLLPNARYHVGPAFQSIHLPLNHIQMHVKLLCAIKKRKQQITTQQEGIHSDVEETSSRPDSRRGRQPAALTGWAEKKKHLTKILT